MSSHIDNARMPKAQHSFFHLAHIYIPQRGFLKKATVGLTLGFLLIILLTQMHFSNNQTQSLPYKVFICFRGILIHRGDFVSIQNHPTPYFGNIHYTKRLIGLPGDRVHIHENQVYINTRAAGKYLIGPLLQKTKEGHALHPLKTTIIPKGYVFVSADHPRSFDSRYEEFGLVKLEHIVGKCFGLIAIPRVQCSVFGVQMGCPISKIKAQG